VVLDWPKFSTIQKQTSSNIVAAKELPLSSELKENIKGKGSPFQAQEFDLQPQK
jgi:hypothetical protein